MAWIDTDSLKHDHPVEEVIGQYGIELRRSGCALIGRCPFHEDGGRPNLYVYPSTRSWYCYRCGIGGDVISFVERIERVGFREAVMQLTGGARELPGAHPCPTGGIKRTPRRQAAWRPDERECLAAAVDLYHNRLLTDRAALAYLAGRGLGRGIIERCRLGYVAGDELVDYLRWRHLPVEAAMRIGLLRRGCSEFLVGRVVVPEIRRGQPVWLIGRTIEPHDERPKYLGLPGRKPLLGWESARDSSEVFLVEGVFDWLTLLSWGYPSLALVGTHAGATALQALSRFERIYLLFDNDAAGQTAEERFSQALGDRAMAVRLASINDVADLARWPDGRERFAQLLVGEEASQAA